MAAKDNVQALLFDVRKNVVQPPTTLRDAVAAIRIAHIAPTPAAGRKMPAHRVVLRGGQADLLEIVAALRSAGRFARRLHRGQKQRDQNADDRDHHQQFDQ